MEATKTMRRNKITLGDIFCRKYNLILEKVEKNSLITINEYTDLTSIVGVNVSGHVTALLDKLLNKGDDTCAAFLELLQTDNDIKSTFPDLAKLQLRDTSLLTKRVQSCLDVYLDDSSGRCTWIPLVISGNECF